MSVLLFDFSIKGNTANSLPLYIIKTDARVKCTDSEIEIGGTLSCQRMLAFLLFYLQKAMFVMLFTRALEAEMHYDLSDFIPTYLSSCYPPFVARNSL